VIEMDIPTVIIYGLPDRFPQEEFERLWQWLKSVFEGISDLGMSQKEIEEIVFYFPPERWKQDFGSEIRIFVDGLESRRHRSEDVRLQLENELSTAVFRFLTPNVRTVGCQVSPFGKGGTRKSRVLRK
jgi:hypothetical protein